MKCPRCEGTGICIECNGTGVITCRDCEGSGKIFKTMDFNSLKTKTSLCGYCHGRGALECSKECSSCGGSGEITLEYQKKIREKYQPSFTLIKEHRAYISLGILIVNFILFIMDFVFGLIYKKQVILDFGELYVPYVLAGEWWRIITPIFIHIDIWHFLLNSYCLFILCPPIERILGPFRFISLYIFSGIVGNLLSMIVIPGIHSAGASGALFGILGAYFGLNLRHRLFHPSIMQQLLFWLVVNVFMGFFGGMNINIWAHLGGLAGGFVCSFLLKIR